MSLFDDNLSNFFHKNFVLVALYLKSYFTF